MGDRALEVLVDRLRDAGEYTPDFLAALRDHVHDPDLVSATLDEYLLKNPRRSATTEANYRTMVELWIGVQGDRPLTT